MNKLIITGERLIIKPQGNESEFELKPLTFMVCDIDKKTVLYEKDIQSELISDHNTTFRPPFRPFGITSDENHVYIASNEKIGKFDKFNFQFIKNLQIPAFTNTHQILRYKSYFFICHTAANAIGLYDIRTNAVRYFKFPEWEFFDTIPIPSDDEFDTVHVNSIYVNDDKLYFCLNNYIFQKNSEFGYIDLNTFEHNKLFEGGFHAHNIAILNNKLYSLSTLTGSILEYDFSTNNKSYYKIAPKKYVWLRGMTIFKDKLLIACSNYYPNPTREKDHFIKSCITTFEPTTLEFSLVMTVPLEFIMDIHLI